MYHGCHTQLSCRYHDIQYVAITELQRIVGHVKLDTGDTILGNDGKLLLYNLLGRIGENDMERVIAVRAFMCQSAILLHDRKNRFVGTVLGSKCHNSCCAPTDRTAGASNPSIASRSVPLFEMDVRIDATRCDEAAFAVEHLCISRTQTSQVGPNTNDAAIFDTDFLTNDAVCSVDLPWFKLLAAG